ncbi:MAG TPA: histidine phosphatase family protein [Candidatus Acidoferrales bacterium]|nr:histidine phosphatase family protein [Candidatus Acidoferrales bacterium]
MSRVFLVRHGQASFSEPTYDKLSAIGIEQARLLGQYWARHAVVFHRVCSGPRLRQRDTARMVAQAYRDAGVTFPDPVVMDEFDEYQGDAVLERSLPALTQNDPQIRKLRDAYEASVDPEERRKNFQKLFDVVITRWVKGEIQVDDVESWEEFAARVNHGLCHLVSSAGRSRQLAIFCSGGPIAVAMQRALQLSAETTLQVAWMVRNGSFSEFLCSGERFTLSAFNAFPHLDGTALLTYR